MLVELIEQQASGMRAAVLLADSGQQAAPLRSARAFRKTTRSALNRTSASGPIWDRVEPPHICASQSTPEIQRPTRYGELWPNRSAERVARRLVHTDSFRRQHRPGHFCHVLRRAAAACGGAYSADRHGHANGARRYRSKGRRRNAAYGVRRRFDRNAHHRSRWEDSQGEQAFAKMLGYTPAELHGKSIVDIVQEEDGDALMRELLSLSRQEIASDRYYRSKDGRIMRARDPHGVAA